ncbi:MAG: hypothetical protein A3I39_01595 [Candidatus Yanofskybacteria bacterium RIFCSPLOWO2_02_FULL_47_9b]|uniref:Uncharacterized protein n=1 Tax=Candidatus Yanofskybacteria bacterium RIFCSPLOWO2_02_FULL_47_9b TaxID=1802708 RepID=A0A1F8HDI1_9BACT|nr:MAG: hypothetical protein A3I39_01595 [Candidatus Yanofskybacteria bacterium RIFCSPLOWO2_02_FULL_47_9b]
MEGLTLIKELTAEEVFETWRKIEENLEHWKSFWKAKGFNSWEEWRRKTHASVLDKKLSWNLYQVKEPIAIIPEWYGGMFHGWAKWFYPVLSEQPPKLKELLTHPGVHNHWWIQKITDNFESPTTISAVCMPSGDIIIVEGMHRACALALMAHEKRTTNIELFVMLTDWPDNVPPKLGTGWDK